jgi:hypothetical protein
MRKYKIGFMYFLATLLVVFVAGCGVETVSIPGVVSVTPAPGATNVAINATISATFNMAMSAASINGTTFTVTAPGGVAVAGSVALSSNGLVATFTPTGGTLANNTTYTATITTGASTPGGAELVSNFVWTFATTALPVPIVVSVTPVPFATNVATNAVISATFNEAMLASSINGTTTFTVQAPGGTDVPGSAVLSGSGLVATFTPTSGALTNNTTYTATITTAAVSTAGAPLVANYVWTFTTITPAPFVMSTVPLPGATGVPITQMLHAHFNEAMLCSTLQSPATTITLTGPGTTPVAITVACAGSGVTITPGSSLLYSTEYTATISVAAEDLAGTPMAMLYQWVFYTVPGPPPPPTVISTIPIDLAVGVPTNQVLSATFSEAMDPATINSATFLLKVTGGATVNGVITYAANGSVATFTPNEPLLPTQNYTANITVGAMDLNDDAAVTPYQWTFTTAAAPLVIPPTVISTIPVTPDPTSNPVVPEDVTVPINQIVSADFSEAMNPTTIVSANFTLTYLVAGVPTPVSGLVAYAGIGNQLVFVPSANLLPGTTYTATISTGVQSLTGVAMATPYTWIFKTSAAVVTSGPEVELTVPASGATGVDLNQAVSATFSEAMNPLTLTNATYQLYTGTSASGTPLPATITYDPVNFIATLTPTNPLAASTHYTAIVTDGATDQFGNPLVAGPVPNPWTFETGTAAFVPPIVLGPTILPFGGFSGPAGMTNTGTLTVINGDSGTTATAYTSYTGFHDNTVLIGGVAECTYTETPLDIGLVTGTIYSPLVSTSTFCPLEGTAADIAIATEALHEATTAYTTLQGLPSTPGSLAAEIGGTTIYPGVYNNATAVDITAGDLTLDAQGDPNAYFIFQIGTTLTVGLPGSPVNIILAHGAKASNIFWAVAGTGVYLEPSGGGTFNGTIIAENFIHVSTANNVSVVTVNGRLISLNASTTLVDTVINVPPAP